MYIVKVMGGGLIAKELTRDEAFELAGKVANKYHTFAYVYRENTLVAIYS